MEMRKCEKGHYYDASIHASCPYCDGFRDTEKTMAMGFAPPPMAGVPGTDNGFERTAAMSGMMSDGIEKTVAMGVPAPGPAAAPASFTAPAAADDGKTVAIFQTEKGVDPVVGWLVRLNGDEKGKDYRIHSDNNFIGRGEKMDICIKGDDTISRENQAILSYDDVEKIYYFSPGEGRSVVRVNGKAILQTAELKAYDKLTIGKTELIFVPLCGKDFSWDEI